MRIFILFIPTLISWAAYDTNLFRKRQSFCSLPAIEISLAEVEQEQKKVKRNKLDVIPTRFKNQRRSTKSRCNYFSSKPRDVRFSDQRKLRRMFNNL